MLPSTGYFKGINCPFYDSGFCERPYCHFRHVKKDSQTIHNDEIESGTILQKLVSAAVQKVLQQTEAGVSPPTHTSNSSESSKKPSTAHTLIPKPTYNPTPIAELNKINNNTDADSDDSKEQKRRHIPVPYTPRKPASIPVKRPVDTNGCNLFTYIPPAKYSPGSSESTQHDPYTPKGSTESTEKYLPGSEAELQEYTPNENQQSKKSNYIPSDKTLSKKKVLEYKPIKVVKSQVPSVTYKPTPRSLAPCFSSDDEEPDEKKRKLSSDLNGLDELGPEFDILDQILDEEKSDPKKGLFVKDNKKSSKTTTEDDKTKKEAKGVIKHVDKKQSDKSKPDKKHDSREEKKKREEKSSDKRSSHKSSHRDKHKSDNKDKSGNKDKTDKTNSKTEKRSTESKSHSSSKKSSCDSRHSKSSSKDSKHSKDSKRKHEKSHHKTHKRSSEKKEVSKRKTESSACNDSSDNDKTHDNEDNYVSSESDEEAIALECKKIFEEYVPVEKPVKDETNECKSEKLDDTDEYIPGKKRISRTIDKDIKVVPRPPAKPDFKANAAQAMAHRLAKVREYHAAKNLENINKTTENITPKINSAKPVLPSGSSKIRIAHVPYASTLLNAKKTISTSSICRQDEPSTSTTITQTVKKGSQRVAHIPSEKFIDRPGVLEPLASKIPANIRSTYLNMMIDNCLQIYLTAEDAYARAQHEELTTSKKCSTIPIYKNSAVLAISRLKKELKECHGIKKSGFDCQALQNIPQAITGKTGTTGSWSIESKNRRNAVDSDQLSGAKFYNNIKKWILSEEQLQDNGFPRPHVSGEKGRAMIYKENKQLPPKGSFRTCCRCKKEYTINKKGFPAVKEECIYHPNNKYRIRGEARYQCCSQDGTSDGCCIASCHVYEYVDYENLKGYVKTLPPSTASDDYGVYSLDCEMCYTTHGLDLTRITVINSACKVVYETLVKPLHPIIDYNTRYSGITEEQMAEVKTTLLEVQATLLTMFNSKTILIGHSLESDFKALKLIHDTIIDTSVLFPHKLGPPYKRALRNLSSEYLKKIIQNSVDGHDSAEDAMVCMELLFYKLKEDLKTR